MAGSSQTASPDMMAVVAQDRLGPPEVLQLDERPIPRPGPSEVLIRVAATSLNPTDWIHRSAPALLGPGPKVLGWDVSGVVEAVGLGVTIHSVGDEVFGMLPYPFGHGAAAEFVVAPARAVAAKPDVLTHSEAAALPLVSLTAWHSLVETAGVRAGPRVLVHAAAGGVGHVAVQIAKSLGAVVVGTSRTANHRMLHGLGIDEVVDYRETDYAHEIRGIDVVIDTLGHEHTERSLQTMRDGGTIVSLALNVTRPLGAAASRRRRIQHRLMLVEHDYHALREVAKLVTAGALRPVIARDSGLFDIEAVREAHRAGESGHVAGKLVLSRRLDV